MRNLLDKLWMTWRVWRVRPGLALAAYLCEQASYRQSSAEMLGPEQNLAKFAAFLREHNPSTK